MGMPVITPGTISRGQVVGDIIESVALQESALAHVLNAESEKLMAVINSSTATSDQILAINQSVKTVINSISRLELLLQAKLDTFSSTICE